MLDTSVKEGGFWDASNVVFLKPGGSTWACALCNSLMHMNMQIFINFCFVHSRFFMGAIYHKCLKMFKADLSKTKYVKLCI